MSDESMENISDHGSQMIFQLLAHTAEMVKIHSESTVVLRESASQLQGVKEACLACQVRCAGCHSKTLSRMMSLLWALVIAIIILAGVNLSGIDLSKLF